MSADDKPPEGLLAQALVAAQARGGARRDGRAGRRRSDVPPRRRATRSPATRRRSTRRASRHRRRPTAADDAAAGRIADDRFRLHAVPPAEGRRGAEAAGVEAAVPRSAVQRDGRPRRLHRRLFEARSDLARHRQAAGAGPLHLRSAGDARQRAGPRRGRAAGGSRCAGAMRPEPRDRRRRRADATPATAATDAVAPSGARRRQPRVDRPRRSGSRIARASAAMSLAGTNLHLCSCNGTMPLDAAALARALELSGAPAVQTMLCQKELAAFAGRADGDVVVACTQEARLFGDVAEEGGRTQTIRFVNIRETGGWSAEAQRRDAEDRGAARAGRIARARAGAARRLSFRGPLLIVGPAEAALHWAKRVVGAARASPCSSPVARPAPSFRPSATFPVYSGRLTKIAGWLGAFDVAWTQENPIDLDLCTRCNACVKACPEEAIDFSYQIDLDRCKAHRKCVAACGATAAIDFARQRRRAQRALRPRPRPAARAASDACTSRRRVISRPAPMPIAQAQGGDGDRGDDGRVREAEVFRVQGVDLRAQPLAEAGLQSVHRRLLDGGHRAPTAITSGSSRICAWAAARARPCARPAR